MIQPPLRSTLFPYTTLFRSAERLHAQVCQRWYGVRSVRHRQGERPERLLRLPRGGRDDLEVLIPDRKSTRLNSSHLGISYAVFCLKKKKKTKDEHCCINHML